MSGLQARWSEERSDGTRVCEAALRPAMVDDGSLERAAATTARQDSRQANPQEHAPVRNDGYDAEGNPQNESRVDPSPGRDRRPNLSFVGQGGWALQLVDPSCEPAGEDAPAGRVLMASAY